MTKDCWDFSVKYIFDRGIAMLAAIARFEEEGGIPGPAFDIQIDLFNHPEIVKVRKEKHGPVRVS